MCKLDFCRMPWLAVLMKTNWKVSHLIIVSKPSFLSLTRPFHECCFTLIPKQFLTHSDLPYQWISRIDSQHARKKQEASRYLQRLLQPHKHKLQTSHGMSLRALLSFIFLFLLITLCLALCHPQYNGWEPHFSSKYLRLYLVFTIMDAACHSKWSCVHQSEEIWAQVSNV